LSGFTFGLFTTPRHRVSVDSTVPNTVIKDAPQDPERPFHGGCRLRFAHVRVPLDGSVFDLANPVAAPVSATLENEADPTLENEATGSSVSSLPCLGF